MLIIGCKIGLLLMIVAAALFIGVLIGGLLCLLSPYMLVALWITMILDAAAIWRISVYIEHLRSVDRPDISFLQAYLIVMPKFLRFTNIIRSIVSSLSPEDAFLSLCALAFLVYVYTYHPLYNDVEMIRWKGAIIITCLAALITRRIGNRRYFYALCFTVLIASAYMALNWYGRCPDNDEIEHIHVTWLISQGRLPFVDFWQHHTVLLYMLLAPIVGRLPHSGLVCDFARVLSLAVSAVTWGMATVLAMKMHKPARGLIPVMILLMAGALTPGEFYDLRPDLFADSCMIGALLLLLLPRNAFRVMLGGLLLGLAVAFTPKHVYLLPLFPLVILMERMKLIEKARSIFIHCIGIAFGTMPMIIWLQAHHLLKEFKYWVIDFNRANVIGGSTHIPRAVTPLCTLYCRIALMWFGALALMWFVKKIVVERNPLDYKNRLLLVSILLSVVALATYSDQAKFSYHLQLFMILTAVGGSDVLLGLLRPKIYNWKSWAAAVLATGFLLGYMTVLTGQAYAWFENRDYVAGREEIDVLNGIADGHKVLCIGSMHPFGTYDATDLYQIWQWAVFLGLHPVASRLHNIDRQVVSEAPVVIYTGIPAEEYEYARRYPLRLMNEVTERLVDQRVLDRQRGERLQKYIEDNYTFVPVVRNCYWIRKDTLYRTEMIHLISTIGEKETRYALCDGHIEIPAVWSTKYYDATEGQMYRSLYLERQAATASAHGGNRGIPEMIRRQPPQRISKVQQPDPATLFH
jgi:hypothetical protein